MSEETPDSRLLTTTPGAADYGHALDGIHKLHFRHLHHRFPKHPMFAMYHDMRFCRRLIAPSTPCILVECTRSGR
jgi:hypothetical protein